MELLYCAVDALRNCDISARFRIELGHAGVFRALTECMGLEEETRAELVHCIERKNVPALRKLLCRIDDCAHSEALLALPKLFGGKETLARAKALLRAKQAQEALEYLSVLYQALCEANLQDVIDIDLSLVHGQEYYTGLVFRGYMEGSGETVLSGGRYDALLAEFGRPAAAVGFAVEVDALAKGMLAHGGFEKQEAQVLVFGAEGFETAALRHGDSLCGEGGAPAEVSLSQSLEEAVLYAKTKGIGRLDIIDENGLRTERTEDL
jgi:ATP phosphoribosyltransferase regulatory subunit